MNQPKLADAPTKPVARDGFHARATHPHCSRSRKVIHIPIKMVLDEDGGC